MLNGDMNLLISTTMKNTGIIITSLLGGLIVWFTFFPPDTALFADLSDAVRTFLTIPV